MSLTLAAANYLRNQYYEWSELTTKKESLEHIKEDLIQFCIDNEVELYNIGALQTSHAIKLLDKLIALFTQDSECNDEKLNWAQEFKNALNNSNELIEMHQKADISVRAQYVRTGTVLPNTLLTLNDITDLLHNASEKIVLFSPISLAEHSTDKTHALYQWIHANQESPLFIPIVHDGHWLYLLRNESLWSIQDSQPIQNTLSTRQDAIKKACQDLLGQELPYKTTGAQTNDFDCGSRVVNAYRAMSNPDYVEQNHQDILYEALTIQSIDEIIPCKETLFPQKVSEVSIVLSEKEKQIITATLSSQAIQDKVARYNQHLEELLIVSKQGFFTGVQNKIAMADMASAEAQCNETDKEFATRLQEAELRFAGL